MNHVSMRTVLHRLAGSGMPAIRLATSAFLLSMLLAVAPADGGSAKRNAPALRLDLYGDPLPPGALARLGTIRLRGGDYGPFFLPDGKTVATANPDAIQFWEIAGGRFLRQIAIDARYRPMAIALSADGKFAAVGNSVWDLATGRKAKVGAGGRVVAFTPDSRNLISFGNGTLGITELSSGKDVKQRQFTKYDDGPNVAVSPDGELLAVATGPNTRQLYLWNWQRKREPRDLKVPGGRVHYLCFSPDSKVLAGADQAASEVQLWDVVSGAVIQTIDMKKERVACAALAFTPDGKMLAVADGGNRRRMESGGVYVWDLTKGKLARALVTSAETTEHMSISPDGRWIGTTSRGGARIWNLHTAEEIAATPEAHHGQVMQIAAAQNGLVATAGEDNTVRIWEAASGRHIRRVQLAGYCKAVALSLDGTKLVSGSWDKKVRLWDVKTGQELGQLPDGGTAGGPQALGFSGDGRQIIYFAGDLSARVWDTDRKVTVATHSLKEFVISIPGLLRDSFISWPCCVSASGKYLAMISHGKVHVIETLTGRNICRMPDESGAASYEISLAFSADDRLLVVSAPGKQLVTKLPNGNARFFTAPNHSMGLWELSSGRLRLSITFPGEQADPAAISPDGRFLVAGAGRAGGDVRVLRVSDGKVLATLNGFRSATTMLAFSPDGKHLIGGMNDTSALVWDFRQVLANVAREPGPKGSLDRSELESLWSDLASQNAAQAHAAIWKLVDHPTSAISLIRDRLKPAVGPDPRRVTRLISDLDNDRFSIREKSLADLEKMGEPALPGVRRGLADSKSRGLESRRRLEKLLGRLLALPPTPETLRGVRTIETLEHIGSPEAGKLLRILANGASEVRLTAQARESLKRQQSNAR